MTNKISAKLTLFLLALKNNNSQRDTTFDEFIAELHPLNKDRISRSQFLKIVQRVNSGGSSFDALQLFVELSSDKDSISVQKFSQLFVKVTSLSNQRMENPREKEYMQQMQMEGMNKKLVKIGFQRLLKWIKSKSNIDPNQIFMDCDEDSSGDIDKSQLNKFLIASEVEQFRDKNIRILLINDIFSKFPSGRIKKDEFFNIFQISESKMIKKPIFNDQKRNQSKRQISNPEQSGFTVLEDIKKTKNIRIKTIKNEVDVLQSKKQNQIKPMLQEFQKKQYFDAYKNDFPLACQYYRLGVPSTSDIPYIEELQRLLKSKKLYTDSANPKSNGSYIYANEMFNEEKYSLMAMSSSDMNRYRGKQEIAQLIEAGDIMQGTAGDCYFLSALASLASNYPQLVSQKFLFEVNPAHYCAVRLFIDGEWRIIKTDDKFSCKNGQSIYTSPKGNEIWVLLVQKIFAKIYRSYDAIYRGNPRQAFLLLTGAPHQRIQLQASERQSILRRIYDASEKGYIMATHGCRALSHQWKVARSKQGLVDDHVYSLLSIHKIGKETLVRLRNPWGHTVWKGAWSYNSSQWTPELKRQLNMENDPKDGSFFMCWNDYFRFFWEINISKLNPLYMHTSFRMVLNYRKSQYVQMKVTTPGIYNIFSCQQTDRKFKKCHAPSNARVVIARKYETGNYQYVSSQFTYYNQVCNTQVMLQKGTYLVTAKVMWRQWAADHECQLVAYGTDKVVFEKVNRSVAPKFKQDVIQSFARTLKDCATVTTFESDGYPNVIQQVLMDLQRSIGYIKIINKSSKEFKCKMTIKTDGNVKMIKPKKSPYEFRLPPSKQDVIGFFIKSEVFGYSKNITFLK